MKNLKHNFHNKTIIEDQHFKLQMFNKVLLHHNFNNKIDHI